MIISKFYCQCKNIFYLPLSCKMLLYCTLNKWFHNTNVYFSIMAKEMWPKSFFSPWSYLRRRFKNGNTHTQDLRWDQILNLVSSVFTRGCNFNNGGISCHLNAIFGAFLFVFLFSLKRLYLCFHCLLNVFHHYNSPKLLHPLYRFSISKLGIQWIFNFP